MGVCAWRRVGQSKSRGERADWSRAEWSKAEWRRDKLRWDERRRTERRRAVEGDGGGITGQ